MDRDKNRASVVAWSCGNESGYGINDQAEFDYVKAHDPTRLAFISQQNLEKNPKTDFEDYHYPKIDVIKSIAASANRAKAPAFLTEYSPSGGGVAYAWDVIWSADGMAGAFLFQWQDEGMIDKFPERWPVHTPGAPPGDYVPGSLPAVDGIPSADMTTGMRLTGGPDAVTTDRRILKPLYYNLKSVYSPVNTPSREVTPAGGQCVVPLQNRYSFTDLSELTCRWQALSGEKVLASGESHVAAKPRSTVDASFPATPGTDSLRLEFIHPDGRSVYVASLRIKRLQSPGLSRLCFARQSGPRKSAHREEASGAPRGTRQRPPARASGQLAQPLRSPAQPLRASLRALNGKTSLSRGKTPFSRLARELRADGTGDEYERNSTRRTAHEYDNLELSWFPVLAKRSQADVVGFGGVLFR